MRSVAIDEVVRNGRLFDPKRGFSMDDIAGTVRELFDDLRDASVEFLLVGGVAMLGYIEGRNTQDIDLLMAPEAIDALPWHATRQDRDFGVADFGSVRVDLLLTSNPVFAHVAENHRASIRFADRVIPCASAEGLLILKLYALPSMYRQNRLQRAALYETDILLLRGVIEVTDEQLLAPLRPHLTTADISELARILEEQRARRRFEDG